MASRERYGHEFSGPHPKVWVVFDALDSCGPILRAQLQLLMKRERPHVAGAREEDREDEETDGDRHSILACDLDERGSDILAEPCTEVEDQLEWFREGS